MAPDLAIYAGLTFAADYYLDQRAEIFEQKFRLFMDELQEQADDQELSGGTQAMLRPTSTEIVTMANSSFFKTSGSTTTAEQHPRQRRRCFKPNRSRSECSSRDETAAASAHHLPRCLPAPSVQSSVASPPRRPLAQLDQRCCRLLTDATPSSPSPWKAAGPTGPTGATGPTGPTGADSTVAGPTG